MVLLSLQSTLDAYIESPFKDSVHDIIQKVTDNYLASFIIVSQVICGIGAVVYIGSILTKILASGGQEKIDLWKLSRPVGILILITLSGKLVCPAIDFVIEEPLIAITESCHQDQQKKITQKRETLETIKVLAREQVIQQDPQEASSGIGNIFSFFTGKDIGTQLTELVWYGLECVADIFMAVAKLIIIMISSLYKIILYIFAPFAFALSMFPYFHDNLKHWFGRYIHASLWVPISYVLELIQNCCTESFLDKQIEFYNNAYIAGSYSVASVDGFQCFAGVVLSIVIGCMYLSIPTLASSIISSAGGEFMTGTAMTSITMLGKAFAVPVNASTDAVKKIVQTAKGKSGN